MHRLEVKRHLDEAEIAAVQDLVERSSEHDGHSALGEHQWLDLVQGGRQGFAGVVAWEEGHGHPVGYAQVTRSDQRPSNWALEVVVAPHHREDGSIGDDLVGRALEIVRNSGGGHVHLWVPKPRPDHDRIAAHHGLRRGRELYQMRRPLPVNEPFDLDTRAFVVGHDDEAWLAVNNAAFAWHPEQGDWDAETLQEREKTDWFDPEGFLLHEEDGELVGFCWTKVHDDEETPLGEIYVVAVDPAHAGRGLGRRLVLAGLDHLYRRGSPVAMLYVDADNRSALRLYFDLGFTIDHIDRAYVTDVDPSGSRTHVETF